MSRFTSFFTGGSRQRQFVLAGALIALLAGTLITVYFVLRPSYQVLFRDLKPQDASAIVAELDKQKVPYRIDETTSAILVPEGDTRAMRLKLMSSDLRLQGAVGFELFNNSDLGLTEFAQKVNYQRALQGELARTIMTLDEIDLARVHLTLPESSIFRRDTAKPKASVALFTRDAQALTPDAVRGIQRLVAAAVPELSPGDVTILDQKGDLASTRSNEIDDPKFALKQAIERGYERKILAQIAPIVGERHASVSVDASLNFDQIRTTRQSDVSQPIVGQDSKAVVGLPLPAPKSKSGMPPAGLPPLPSFAASDGTKTDRKLEQVVSEPGSIRRLSVGVVLDRALPQEDVARINAVVAASIGLDPARGDVLSIFVGRPASAAAPATPANAGVAPPIQSGQTHDIAATNGNTTTAGAASRAHRSAGKALLSALSDLRAELGLAAWSLRELAVCALAALLAVAVIRGLLVRSLRRPSHTPQRALSQQQRDEYLVRLRALLVQEGNPDARR